MVLGDAAIAVEESAFLRRWPGDAPDAPRHRRPGSVWPGLAQAGEERVAERFHAGNGGGAQQQAEEEDAKARKPPRSSRRANCQAEALFTRDHHTLDISSATMRPLSSRTTRWQRRARLSSCVTRNSVAPRSAFSANKQIGDGLAVGAVEIAGGFVGEQDLRPGRHGARQRHALLLAAGQLARIMIGRGRQARPPSIPPRRGPRHRPRRSVPAAPRHFPAPSWWE